MSENMVREPSRVAAESSADEQTRANPYRIEGPALISSSGEYLWPTVEEAIVTLGLRITPEQFISIFRIEGPALISFSGGRTSALMLWCILVAHGGRLPPTVIVSFANTGKEREETLRFVHECGSRWGVPIRWLEWRDAKPCFDEVGFNSASRSGEPFAGLIAKKGYLPNAVTRFCTLELKVRVMRDFARSLGWDHWSNVVGLRHDEGWRVLKALAANDAGKERWRTAMPLAKAKVTERDVFAFWAAQPFDLGLRSYEGNCDLCFLKSRGKLLQIIRDQPEAVLWWADQEATVATLRATETGRRFRDETYAGLAMEVALQPLLPLIHDDEEHDVECGLLCAPEAA